MNTLKNYAKDIIKALLIAAGISSGIAIIFGIIGLCIKGGEFSEALRISQQGLFIIGSFMLIIVAALLLKRDGRRALSDKEGWRRQFKVINFSMVILIVGVFILFAGGMLDYV